MAVGSSFDAYVKSALHAGLFGTAVTPKFAFEKSSRARSNRNRDFARKRARSFNAYKLTGAFDELLALLRNRSRSHASSSRSMASLPARLHRQTGLPLRVGLRPGPDPLHP